MSRRRGGLDELGKIELLRQIFAPATPPASVATGIGDDAAVLRLGARRVVWTVDAAVEGSHFQREWLSLRDVGWRSFQAAVSDLAAMGAEPLAALSALVLPRGMTRVELRRMGLGLQEAAADTACPVVGGNIAKGPELSLTTTVLGCTSTPLLRSGARPGDEVWLLGTIGMAAAGMKLLQQKVTTRKYARERKACILAWRRPRALLPEGRMLARVATAAIDVSDGLAGDASHIADASGVKIVLDEELLRGALTAELLAVSRLLSVDPLQFALYGGEDYALVATGPACSRPSPARPIGAVLRGTGVSLRGSGGQLDLGRGFDHFR